MSDAPATWRQMTLSTTRDTFDQIMTWAATELMAQPLDHLQLHIQESRGHDSSGDLTVKFQGTLIGLVPQPGQPPHPDHPSMQPQREENQDGLE